MKTKKNVFTLAAWWVGFVLISLIPTPDLDAALEIEHRLDIELFPATHMLAARDVMRIRVDDRNKLVFALSERVFQLRVEVDGQPRSFKFAHSELEVPLEANERHRTIEAVIAYEARFNDPVPISPLNTDNPGFGVTASITPAGTFLLAGAGWYPDLADGRDAFPLLRVKAPQGILAVTAGLCLGHAARDEFSISEWRIDHPLRGLALSAAAFQLQEKRVGDAVAATYFMPQNQDLAPAYLDAIATYLERYTNLFGPYPFPKFAVVENFFPTGYGFPSYTLLGGSILRLPFILSTSLGHEIAHCWWGNGVFVEYDSGNWSEGLTTYLADYYFKERESAAAARDYRLQALRNFTTLVPPAKDFPLARFTGRIDTVTKAVGYDKAMMVFHMLRREIGDEAFWGALRDLYRERLFQATGWEDLRRAFEKRSQRSLDNFFQQWVNRKGAPRIHLADLQREPASDAWKIKGRLVQEKPFFNAGFDLAVHAGGRQYSERVQLSDDSTSFEIAAAHQPTQVVVDPDVHMLRRLAASEIPPTVNGLKSSAATLIVVCGTDNAGLQRIGEILAESLGLRRYVILSESRVDPQQFKRQDVILLGYPRKAEWLRTTPSSLRLAQDGVAFSGTGGGGAGELFFGVFTHPYDAARVIGVLLPPGRTGAAAAAAKITHYGRFSYLFFQDGHVRDRGTWESTDSEVRHLWN